MRDVLGITKALADESRLRILMMLDGRELCVCQIVEVLGLAASTVSKHLFILHGAGLVESRKDGRWVYYRRGGADSAYVGEILGWLTRNLAAEPAIAKDRRRLAAVLAIPREELCRAQDGSSSCSSSAPATPAAARWPKDGLAT